MLFDLYTIIDEETKEKDEEVNESPASEAQVNDTENSSSDRVKENESVMDKESEVTETNKTNLDEGGEGQTSKPDEPVKEEDEEEKMEETKEAIEGKKKEEDKPDTQVVKDEPKEEKPMQNEKEGNDSGVGPGDESGVSPGDDSGVGPSEFDESSKTSGGGDSTDVLSGMDWQDGVASLEGSDMKVGRMVFYCILTIYHAMILVLDGYWGPSPPPHLAKN